MIEKYSHFASLLFLIFSFDIAAEIKNDCDLPQDNLRTFATKNADLCKNACQRDNDCAAFVFVSGWDRCLLKKILGKEFKIRLSSGTIGKDPAGRRVISETRDRHDLLGIDLKKVVSPTAESCAALCIADEDCGAFTYIDGYQICWFKKETSRWVSKIFYCGIK